MKKLWIVIWFVLLPLGMCAQQQTAYNRKGDEAMARKDYRDAKMWYEEGVAQCDAYSVRQLTSIWIENERMRPSMRSLMNKCLNCLNVMATENDTTAVNQLIVYYTQGIGTPQSEELAHYWTERLESIRKADVADGIPVTMEPQSPKERMNFFVGYQYAIEAPYGITVGGVGRRLGWYVRFKTNMSFQDYNDECNKEGMLVDFSETDKSYEVDKSRKNKVNSIQGTAGLVVKCCPWLYASVGLGYGERALIHPFITHSTTSYEDVNAQQKLWAKNMDASYKGVAAEADLMVRWKSVFVSVGCNTVNFKYVDLNAGLGVFF